MVRKKTHTQQVNVAECTGFTVFWMRILMWMCSLLEKTK